MTNANGPAADVLGGRRIEDPYRWLESSDSADVVVWSDRQRANTAAELGPLPGQQTLIATLRGLLTRPPASAAKPAGDRQFRVARAAGGASYSVEMQDRSEGPDAQWRTVLAPDQLPEHSIISRWQPSPHGRFLAVQVVEAGVETVTPVLVLEVDTGRLVDTTRLSRYSPIEWGGDEERFYWVRRHLDGPGYGVYLHRVGTDPDRDVLITGDDDPMGRYSIALWHDRWLVVSRRRGTGPTTSRTLTDLDSDAGIAADIGASGAALLIDSSGRLIQTDDRTDEFGVVQVAESPGEAARGEWQQLVASSPGAIVRTIVLLPGRGGTPDRPSGAPDRLALLRTRDAVSELEIVDARTGEPAVTVTLPGAGTVASMGPGDEPGTLTIAYTDWSIPMSLWRVDATTGVTSPIDSSVRRQAITVVRDTYAAPDGTRVPITVLRRDDDDGTQPRPLLLTCYGGFGLSVSPSFQPDSLAWVLCGGRMSVAGVRGGGDRGRPWHRAGSGANKPTGFADLHAAGDWLVDNGWTRRDQLALMGGSNGGMMVTGAVAQRPSAYAALAAVGAPLDMVRYPLFGLGRAWLGEYGDPADEAALDVLLSYSPYHNVEPGDHRWPAALFSVGSNDTRVDPLHSRKMVARLQEQTAGRGPVVLKVLDGGGHVGVFNPSTEQMAGELLAFLARHTGLQLEPAGPAV